jgi:carbohydrate-binding DOMON domain-containing protein
MPLASLLFALFFPHVLSAHTTTTQTLRRCLPFVCVCVFLRACVCVCVCVCVWVFSLLGLLCSRNHTAQLTIFAVQATHHLLGLHFTVRKGEHADNAHALLCKFSTHTSTHTYTHTHTRAHIHTRTYTHTHSHIHTQTHTHTSTQPHAQA